MLAKTRSSPLQWLSSLLFVLPFTRISSSYYVNIYRSTPILVDGYRESYCLYNHNLFNYFAIDKVDISTFSLQ